MTDRGPEVGAPEVSSIQEDDPAADAGSVPAPVRSPRRHAARWIATAIGLVFVLFITVLATRRSATDRLADSPLLGKPAPELAGASVLSGARFRLSEMRGRWVLVNFFATWCIPCRREQPELVEFSRRHLLEGDASVVVVIYDDSVAAVRRFYEREGGDWPVLPDPKGQVALDYGVSGVPESFLVDPRGYVVAKVVGGVTADGLDRLLAQASGGAP